MLYLPVNFPERKDKAVLENARDNPVGATEQRSNGSSDPLMHRAKSTLICQCLLTKQEYSDTQVVQNSRSKVGETGVPSRVCLIFSQKPVYQGLLGDQLTCTFVHELKCLGNQGIG